MSLWHAYSQGGQVFVCADSRVSIKEEGIYYRVSDRYRKLRCIGSKAVFISGNVEFDVELFAKFEPVDSIEIMQKKLLTLYEEYNNRCSFPLGFEIVVAIVALEQEGFVLYQMNSRNLFELSKTIMLEHELFNLGAYSSEVRAYLPKFSLTYPLKTVPELIQMAYEKIADELVGGYLHSFVISQEGIERNTRKIRDQKLLRNWKGGSFPFECYDYNAV